MATRDAPVADDGAAVRRSSSVDAALVAVLVGGAAGAGAAASADVSGLAVLGVVLGASLALGGLLVVPSVVR